LSLQYRVDRTPPLAHAAIGLIFLRHAINRSYETKAAIYADKKAGGPTGILYQAS
jgi:hypothetical protein